MFFCWLLQHSSRRKWQPTPVFLPGEVHGQRSPAGYSPWGCKESDMTDRLSLILTAALFTMTKYGNNLSVHGGMDG